MIKIILRSVFYPFFVLFVGITIGFIANAEWSGRKYIMIEKSINNIFFPVNKYNKNVEEYVRYMGGLKLMSNHDYPKDFIILDTNKWQVPLQRPPVCINNSPCRVCPIDSASYPLDLLQWQTSNNITNNEPKINKKWVADQ